MMMLPLLVLLLVAIMPPTAAAATAAGKGGCSLVQQPGVPVNPHLFGYNLEVFGTMTSNLMNDTAGIAIADALHLGTLRYPGGTMSNVWDPVAGQYITDKIVSGQGGYGKFRPYAELIESAGPAGTFSAKSFLAGLGGRAQSTIWDLNVYAFNTSQACAQIEYIASLPNPTGGVHLLELGNELYSKGQGLPKFINGSSYAEQMKPIIACARRILPKAKIGVVAFSGPSASPWARAVASAGLDVDAVTLHTYIPHDAEVGAVPEAQQLGYIAVSKRVARSLN
jgi:hypothetical protein